MPSPLCVKMTTALIVANQESKLQKFFEENTVASNPFAYKLNYSAPRYVENLASRTSIICNTMRPTEFRFDIPKFGIVKSLKLMVRIVDSTGTPINLTQAFPIGPKATDTKDSAKFDYFWRQNFCLFTPNLFEYFELRGRQRTLARLDGDCIAHSMSSQTFEKAFQDFEDACWSASGLTDDGSIFRGNVYCGDYAIFTLPFSQFYRTGQSFDSRIAAVTTLVWRLRPNTEVWSTLWNQGGGGTSWNVGVSAPKLVGTYAFHAPFIGTGTGAYGTTAYANVSYLEVQPVCEFYNPSQAVTDALVDAMVAASASGLPTLQYSTYKEPNFQVSVAQVNAGSRVLIPLTNVNPTFKTIIKLRPVVNGAWNPRGGLDNIITSIQFLGSGETWYDFSEIEIYNRMNEKPHHKVRNVLMESVTPSNYSITYRGEFDYYEIDWNMSQVDVDQTGFISFGNMSNPTLAMTFRTDNPIVYNGVWVINSDPIIGIPTYNEENVTTMNRLFQGVGLTVEIVHYYYTLNSVRPDNGEMEMRTLD